MILGMFGTALTSNTRSTSPVWKTTVSTDASGERGI
jgi:hypothetical protein